MLTVFRCGRATAALLACAVVAAAAVAAEPARAAARDAHHAKARSRPAAAPAKSRTDVSGRKRVGKASFYADKFNGRKMADGSRMNPQHDVAASKTLPLGTRAKVRNLETGKSAVVTIKDRGPYVKDRIVDLTPATAQKIGITKDDGVAKVEVTPLSVPKADAGAKPGTAASGTMP